MTSKTAFRLILKFLQELRDIGLVVLIFPFFILTLILPQKFVTSISAYFARHLCIRIPRLNKLGLDNLKLAFPDKTDSERYEILKESWDNLGRLAAEYFYFDQLWKFDSDAQSQRQIEVVGIENFKRLAASSTGSIILSAHLANWELPMIAAAHHGLRTTALYKRPKSRWIANMVLARRKESMEPLVEARLGALQRLSQCLSNGTHVGLLVDQYHITGTKIKFFGHETQMGEIFARLVRIHECPVHMVRVIRLPNDRFRVELSDAIELPRTADGKIDIPNSLQVVADIIEGWVREYPGQWLWVHRRWR